VQRGIKGVDYKYTVRIPWKIGDEPSKWNEVCAYAIEKFGMPGADFITHPNEDYMDFMFRYHEDAVVFSLACE
jgi:hypothetical protein